MIGRRPRPKAHKLADPVVSAEVQLLLDKQWSPEQISVSLAKRADGPQVSVGSTYRGIYNPLSRSAGRRPCVRVDCNAAGGVLLVSDNSVS